MFFYVYIIYVQTVCIESKNYFHSLGPSTTAAPPGYPDHLPQAGRRCWRHPKGNWRDPMDLPDINDIFIGIYMYNRNYVCMYIYMDLDLDLYLYIVLYMYIYILYIYIYIYIYTHKYVYRHILCIYNTYIYISLLNDEFLHPNDSKSGMTIRKWLVSFLPFQSSTVLHRNGGSMVV
jgi:hypothetical protein